MPRVYYFIFIRANIFSSTLWENNGKVSNSVISSLAINNLHAKSWEFPRRSVTFQNVCNKCARIKREERGKMHRYKARLVSRLGVSLKWLTTNFLTPRERIERFSLRSEKEPPTLVVFQPFRSSHPIRFSPPGGALYECIDVPSTCAF